MIELFRLKASDLLTNWNIENVKVGKFIWKSYRSKMTFFRWKYKSPKLLCVIKYLKFNFNNGSNIQKRKNRSGQKYFIMLLVNVLFNRFHFQKNFFACRFLAEANNQRTVLAEIIYRPIFWAVAKVSRIL